MKINIGSEYAHNSQKFISKIQTDQNNSKLSVYKESGRKYDKIIFSKTEEKDGHIKYYNYVKYFIERATGDIYGAKSNIAPHFKWFYGNIENCEKWDWSGEIGGTPINDPSVRLVSEFKNYKHFQKVVFETTK